MRGPGLLLAALCISLASARADEPAQTRAFEAAYAASFYQFDACGDGLAGRAYRQALSQKVAQCPFPADIKKRFVLRAAAQRKKSGDMMAKLIEDTGGLPVRLDGMTRTCREQMDSPEYQAVRARLNDFSTGKAGPDTVIPDPCDTPEITP
jgi:hypothetical protein